jgi:hypothetical protein
MNTRKLLIACSATLLPMTAALAQDASSTNGSDETAAAVATLKQKLGSPSGMEVDNVRVTDSGVACINYRLRDSQGSMVKQHAVVKGDDVERSTFANKKFEKAWNDNCLGPRGGTTSAAE